MRDATRPDGGKANRRKGGSIAYCAALLAILLIVAGCSSEKRYKVLSFFFDGVPDPNAPAVSATDEEAEAQRAGGVAKAVGFTHKPYADNNCNACHDNARGSFDDFQKLGSEVCLKCHDDVRDQWPVMHGPVSAGECNLCHVPHESSIQFLLRDTAPAVCVQCHQPELLSAKPAEHLMPDKSCLDCHSGHGSASHGLLKSVAIGGSPSTAPSRTDAGRGQVR